MHAVNANNALWGEAVRAAAYLIERSPTATHPTTTPLALYKDKKTTINKLHVWGCDVYYHVMKEKRENKFAASAALGVFVGYDSNNETYYRVLDIEKGKVIVVRDVQQFNENSFKAMKQYNDEMGEDNTIEFISNERDYRRLHAHDDDGID